MAYRDEKGRFISNQKTAEKAIDEKLDDKYVVSKKYDGPEKNAIAVLAEPNPYWKGQFEVKNKIEYPKNPGTKPDLVTVAEKYKTKNKPK